MCVVRACVYVCVLNESVSSIKYTHTHTHSINTPTNIHTYPRPRPHPPTHPHAHAHPPTCVSDGKGGPSNDAIDGRMQPLEHKQLEHKHHRWSEAKRARLISANFHSNVKKRGKRVKYKYAIAIKTAKKGM